MENPSDPIQSTQQPTSFAPPSLQPSKLGKFPKPVLVVVIVLVLLGGTSFAFYQFFPDVISKLNPFRSDPYKPDEILKAFEKSGTITSARYSASFFIETQDRDPNLKSLVVKVPKGEVPSDLSSYYITPPFGSSSVKSSDSNATVVDLSELKSYYDAEAIDTAKLRVVSSAFIGLRSYYSTHHRDPENVSEADQKLGSFQGKYFTYKASDAGQKFTISFTLDSDQVLADFKKRIDNIKNLKSSFGTSFDPSSIQFNDNKITLNEKFINQYNNLYYYGSSASSTSFLDVFGNSDSLLSYLPGSFKFNLDVGGIYNNDLQTSSYFKLGGKADFEDLVVEADAEFTVVGSESFIKINKFPSIFMDVSKVRGQWIKMTSLGQSTTGDDYSYYLKSISDSIAKSRKESDKYYAQLRKMLSLAQELQVIKATGNPSTEEIGGSKAYKYLVTIDEDKLSDFYERLIVDLKSYGDDALVKKDGATSALLKGNGFKEVIKYIKDVSDLYIWVNSDGYIVKYQYDFKYIPPVSADKVKNKQYHLVTSTELGEINKNLKVEAPSQYINLNEAMSKLFGITEIEY